MYNLNRQLSKEVNLQVRLRIMTSMKSLTNEIVKSPYFTPEIVKQYPKWDWNLYDLVNMESFDYDLLYILSHQSRNWNGVLKSIIEREDFSMQIVKSHPNLNWKDYGYLLVKVYNFTNEWKDKYPEWIWKSQDDSELIEKLNKMSFSIDEGFTLRLPVPASAVKSIEPPSNLPRKRKRIDVSPERDYEVLNEFKLESLISNEDRLCKTPPRNTRRSKSIENAPERKRMRRNSYEF